MYPRRETPNCIKKKAMILMLKISARQLFVWSLLQKKGKDYRLKDWKSSEFTLW
jgi:hypothetical protein